MPDRKDGSPPEVIPHVARRKAWVFTRGGRKVRHIEELRRGPTLLDGRPRTP